MSKIRAQTQTITLDLTSVGGGVCPCSVRVSERARYVRLVVDAAGLSVVVPAGFCVARDLAPILESRKGWIVNALEKRRLRPPSQDCGENGLPVVVDLQALGEVWRVRSGDDTRERLKTCVRDDSSHPVRTLFLSPDFNRSEALVAIRRWVLLRAKETLPPWLRELAAEFGFSPAGVVVKPLKSRWGSCSALSNVNLSGWLLFLPPRLVRHVLLHELCHLHEMNHSKAFYGHLKETDPEAERHAGELKTAWSLVPAWVRG